MQLAESGVKADLRGTATAGTGPDLAGYPHLVYATVQWGPGVQCASNGVSALGVAYGTRFDPIEVVAATHDVTLHEIVDALRYARATGLI